MQSSYKEFAKKMFEAVGVKGGSSSPYVWWCLLALCTPEDLPSELLPGEGDEEKASKKVEPKGDVDGEENGEESASSEAAKFRLQDICTPSGCSIVICLLRFPPATIQPLSAGFKKFVKASRDCKIAVKKWKGKGAECETEVQ